MKINDALDRLLNTEQAHEQAKNVGSSGAEGFEEVLLQQIGGAQTQTDAVGKDSSLLQALADPLRLANIGTSILGGLEKTDSSPDSMEADVDQLMQNLMGGFATSMDSFADFASSLNNQNPGALKNAWNVLDNLDSNLASLRQEMGRLPQPNADLEAVLNELEILAVTERFKFNRGDYLA